MNNKLATPTLFGVTFLLLSAFSPLFSEPATYNFKDPKGVNNVTFMLDAPLESINGTADGISGKVSFDPNAPQKTSGKIVVKVESLTVPNPEMQKSLLGDQWMHEERYPEIVFETEKLKEVEQNGADYKATAVGSLTVKGVTKEKEVPVRLTYLPGKLSARSGGKMQGDLLVIRSSFGISRNAYNIKKGKYADKVAETIELRISIAGYNNN